MLVSTAMAGNDPNEIAGAIAWVVVPADGPAPNTKLVPANGTDLILSVDVADGADMLPLLSEKADTPIPPVTAFSTEGATAVVGALSTFPSALDVVVVPNTTTFVLSFSSSLNDRGNEGLAVVAVSVTAPAVISEASACATLVFFDAGVAAAAAPRLNLLGNGVFGGVMTCRDDGVDGSVRGLGGGVPTVNPT